MLLDSSIHKQTYIEDCEVCCNPIEVTSEFHEHELIAFESQSLEQSVYYRSGFFQENFSNN